MGDPDAPPLQSQRLLGVLDRAQVRYVVVGGLAAVIHGSARATFDIDITPDWSTENLDRLSGALIEMDARLRVPDGEPVAFPIDRESLGRFEVSTWRTRYGDLDVVVGTPRMAGGLAGYDDLSTRAITRQAFGLTIEVAALDDVIEAKRALRREPDLVALPELYRLREVTQE